MLVNEFSSMDSNNFLSKGGVGEREGRVACDLVRRRHYNLSHGIGRSGDLAENQPKAVGSSLMSQLLNELLLDFVHMTGVRSAKKCILFPVATGMAMMLSLLSLKSTKSEAKYVLWSRIDQKSCFKAIVTANLIPIIIDTVHSGNELCTNVKEFEQKIEEFGVEKIICIISTTSCFAPRACDDIEELAKLAKRLNIAHVINNAYGLQSSFLTHQIEQAQRVGRVDLVIQSTDKNLLVPVGGSIIFAFDEKILNAVSKLYPGRASSSQSLDVFMTLLSLGREGFSKLLSERKEMFLYLKEKLENLASSHNEKVLVSKRNPISIAMTVQNFKNPTMIGSMLFTRGVSGVRIITDEVKSIDGYVFHGWGSHISISHSPYLTAAASIGIKKNEIDSFIEKLDKVLLKYKN